MKKTCLLIILRLCVCQQLLLAQTGELRKELSNILATKQAAIGISIKELETGDTLSINGNRHYPMQSVFKFHIALAVLDLVDKGKFALNQAIAIKKTDWDIKSYSPLRDKYGVKDIVQIRLDTILAYTVSQSDNNGCDLLLQLIGGPSVVNNYLHRIGIKDVAVVASEEQMHANWNVQFTNFTTPLAATELLQLFYEKKLLSAASHAFLWKLMTETSTGPKRIKGLLPAGTAVAHKTGTSITQKGITAAVNDIGIVTLPNGQHFIVSVFVSNSKENEETNEAIIAAVARKTWDYFAGKGK